MNSYSIYELRFNPSGLNPIMPRTNVIKTISRREREIEQRRREILGAAERLFARRGFFKTGMADIAQASEFAVGSLYQFFNSKDEIYAALMEEKFEEYRVLAGREVDGAQGAVEKIEALVTTQLQFFEKHRDFFRIFASESGGAHCTVKGVPGAQVSKQYDAYLDLIARVMQTGIRQGLFKKMDSRELAHLFSGMMKSVIQPWIVSAGDEPLIGKAAVIREVFLRGALKDKGR